jgi:zinc protease
MNLLRTTLDNGLKILILETHTAPVASFWAWYRVGSRNERPGRTGISHWLEHMLFKGSERWPEGKADQAIAREGGIFNGMTWYDFTTYYETLPASRLYLAMDIEADRMQHAHFPPEAVESERSVIVSERQGNENHPLFKLGEAVSETAYREHPYGHEVVGTMDDLQSITHEDLADHYRTYYTPGNAVLAIAGDFNAGETRRICERYFGDIERGPAPPVVTTVEPPQEQERRVEVAGAGRTDYLQVAYHVPSARHEDLFALTVLNAVLSGGSGFLVSRGGITNHTSRLYRALVETELMVSIHGAMMPTIDPGLYRLTATLWPGREVEAAEAALDAEIQRVQETPVAEAELEKAQRQARALFAYSSESVTHQAFWMGFSEIFADYGWVMRYLDRLKAVTAADVQRVAQAYLRRDNRTVGLYRAH